MKTPLFLLALLAAASAHAQTYKWNDVHGKVIYSDKPPASGVTASTLRTTPASAPQAAPKKTSKAGLEDVAAVPYLDDDGRKDYMAFLKQPSPRAFVLCKDGRHSTYASSTEDAVNIEVRKAIASNKPDLCRIYAHNNEIVW